MTADRLNNRCSNNGEAMLSSRPSPRVSGSGIPVWTYGSSTCSSDSDIPDTDEELGLKGNKGSKPWFSARSFLGAPVTAARVQADLSDLQIFPNAARAGSRWRVLLAALNVILLFTLAGCGVQMWSMQQQATTNAMIIASLRDNLQQTGFELDDQRTSVVSLKVKLAELQSGYTEEKAQHEKDQSVKAQLKTELGKAVGTTADVQVALAEKTKLADRLAFENAELAKKLRNLEDDARLVKKEMETLNIISSKLHVS